MIPTWICAIITITLWSSAFVGVRSIVNVIDPFEFAFLRLVFATLTLGIIAYPNGIKKIPLRSLMPFALAGLLGATLYFSFLNLGLDTLGAAESCVVINTIPLFTAFFSWTFFKEHLHRYVWIGMWISLTGIAIISYGQSQHGFQLDSGVFWVIGAAISMALCTLIQKGLLNKYPSTMVTFYSSIFGTLFCLPLGWKGVIHIQEMELTHILVLIYLGVFPAGIAYYFWTMILKRVSPSKAVNLLYFAPVVTSFMAYFVLNENLTISTFIGALITLLGLGISQNKFKMSPYPYALKCRAIQFLKIYRS